MNLELDDDTGASLRADSSRKARPGRFDYSISERSFVVVFQLRIVTPG
jgi:hypothetical protein